MCYNTIKSIPLKKYTWRDDVYTTEQVPDRSKLGWIAQDVEQVIPKAVEQKEMFGYSDCRTLNSDQLIASLYGAVQKLMETVEQLQIDINIMKNQENVTVGVPVNQENVNMNVASSSNVTSIVVPSSSVLKMRGKSMRLRRQRNFL